MGQDKVLDAAGGSIEPSVDLLARARTGDEEALERLCERYRSVLRGWARGRLPLWARDLVDTEDIVQDTLVRTIRRIGDFEPRHDGALQAYFRQALQNRIRDEIRRRKRAPERASLDTQTPDDTASPLERSIGGENLERYEAALERLDPADRELIVLRIEMNLSYGELAEAVGKPSANAARMAVLRALLRLGEEIGRDT